MNHPIHPEDVTFAGLVMGRAAVTVAPALPAELPSLVIDAEAAKYFTKGYDGLAFAFAPFARAIIAADREWRLSNAQAALAAPVAAQQEPVAWMTQAGALMGPSAAVTKNAPLYGWTPLYTHPAAAQKISAWLHTGELGKCWATIGPSGSSNPEALYLHPAVPVTDAGYFYNLVMHALMDVDAPHGGCKSRLKDIAEKLEVLMIASRGQA